MKKKHKIFSQSIDAGEDVKFAIVMMDVNNLKAKYNIQGRK